MMVDITCIHALRNMHPDELQSTTDACRAIKDASILWQLSYEARPCMPSQHTMFTAKLSYKARTSMPSQQRNATQRGYTKQWRRTDDATTKLKLKGTVQLSTNTVPRFHDRSWILVFSSICCRFVSRCFSMFLNLFYVSRFCHFFLIFSRNFSDFRKPQKTIIFDGWGGSRFYLDFARWRRSLDYWGSDFVLAFGSRTLWGSRFRPKTNQTRS